MLASARELVTFHADRALLYRVLAEMLGAPPTPKNVRTLTELLGDAGRRGSPAAAVEEALALTVTAGPTEQYRALVQAADNPLAETCADDAEPTRSEAFRAAGRTEDRYPASDALVLAALADRTSRAIRHNDLTEASGLLALQHRFLERHARACLGAVAARLFSSGAPYYALVGRALDELTREDLALLDHAAAPRVAERSAPRR